MKLLFCGGLVLALVLLRPEIAFARAANEAETLMLGLAPLEIDDSTPIVAAPDESSVPANDDGLVRRPASDDSEPTATGLESDGDG